MKVTDKPVCYCSNLIFAVYEGYVKELQLMHQECKMIKNALITVEKSGVLY